MGLSNVGSVLSKFFTELGTTRVGAQGAAATSENSVRGQQFVFYGAGESFDGTDYITVAKLHECGRDGVAIDNASTAIEVNDCIRDLINKDGGLKPGDILHVQKGHDVGHLVGATIVASKVDILPHKIPQDAVPDVKSLDALGIEGGEMPLLRRNIEGNGALSGDYVDTGSKVDLSSVDSYRGIDVSRKAEFEINLG